MYEFYTIYYLILYFNNFIYKYIGIKGYDADAIIICYDKNDEETFRNCAKWSKQIEDYAKKKKKCSCNIISM